MQVTSKFVLTLVFIIGVSSQSSSVKAQRGSFQPRTPSASRVIKLQNSEANQSGASQIVVSRQGLVNPTQIQFDQTGSPIAQPPRATGLPQPRSNQLLQPMTPKKSVPIVRPNQKQRNTTPAKIKSGNGETVTIQNQLVSTEIRSPETVNVNQSAALQIKLKNLSSDAVENVKLIAEISEHAKFLSANPSPSKVEGRTYEFIIPQIGNEQSQVVMLNLVPTKKAPLKIGTQVVLENIQQTIVGVKQPELSLEIVGPQHITAGKSQKHQLQITNVGDAIATGVQIETNYPAYLRPTQGINPSTISAIKPGGSVNVAIESFALAPGNGKLEISATASNAKQQKTTFEIGVYEPELHLSAAGPKINFLQRGGIYSIDVENTGEVDITNLSVMVSVPTGLKVTTISRPARIEADQSVLTWNFDKLPPNSMEQIQLKAIASQEGQQICNILVISDDTVKKEFRLATQVITRADLNVGIKNQTGPIEVGSKAEFLVEIENNGSRAANDVEVNVVLPGSLVVAKDTPNYNQSNNSITFTDQRLLLGRKRFSGLVRSVNHKVITLYARPLKPPARRKS